MEELSRGSRREFLGRLGLVAVAAVGAGVFHPGTQDAFKAHQDKRFEQKIQEEITLVKKDIEKGIHEDKDKVNIYAEPLLQNNVAIERLALLRVLFKANSVSKNLFSELGYGHNFTKGCLKLGEISPQEIIKRFRNFLTFFKKEKQDINYSNRHGLLYSLLDSNFNFNLKIKDVEIELDKFFSGWSLNKPTHQDKSFYTSYNKLTEFDIFQLNRIKTIICLLQDPYFVSEIFRVRDLDVKNKFSEMGGVINLPGAGDKLNNILSKEGPPSHEPKTSPAHLNSNNFYHPTKSILIEEVASVARFHFHALETDMDESYHGPSGIDLTNYVPGVVFTSMDEDTILVHFYEAKDRSYRDVVFLGKIKKPKPEN